METVSCPICYNDKLESISTKGQFGFTTNVVICPNDGMVFLSPRWDRNTYKEFYRKEYAKFYRRIINDSISSHVLNTRLNSMKLIKDRMSILEIGAGMGNNLACIGDTHDLDLELHAIEASEQCMSHLVNRGITLIANSAESLDTVDKYDLIILRHVFEHFLSPELMLDKIYTALKPGGALYIAVPDMMNPSGSLDRHWFRVVHTHYYSRETLLYMLSRSMFYRNVLYNENHELWGVFTKMRYKGTYINNVYEEQMKVIKKQKFKSIFYNLIRR